MALPEVTNAIDGSTISLSELEEIQKRYKNEREKRLRADGRAQFVDFTTMDKFAKAIHNAWPDPVYDNMTPGIKDGSRCEFLFVGAGYGALTSAVRLLDAGVAAEDIRFVDTAGGFGGTWWLNRYPGLMCDVESYMYMPLLEETGYMPKHKYSYGPELRAQAERIAKKWGLFKNALFRVKVMSMTFDEEKGEWATKLQSLRAGEEAKQITVRSRFAFLATGVQNWPKIPGVSGVNSYKGHMFHTAVWDYEYTGGSEQDPHLTNLKDKKVGIIGTGATAIQAVPELAKWANKLYVFQRTPSAVDTRGQRATDPEWWKTYSSKHGWQKERRLNHGKFTHDEYPRPVVDLVNDEWSTFPSYSGLIGGPNAPMSPEEIPKYVEKLQKMDLVRQKRLRARVDEVIKDKTTAEALKAWYSGWCKRPCFHDDYLPSFNKDNVTLVNTDGRGIEKLTEKGIVANGEEYDLDLIIWSTGYELYLQESPGKKARIDITGRNGRSLDQKWADGISTLYGVQSNGFPNLFWLGFAQTGVTSNQTFVVDELSQLISRLFKAMINKVQDEKQSQESSNKYPFVVEPTVDAEEAWTKEVLSRSGALATLSHCPPSYFNAEGKVSGIAQMDEATKMKAARGSTWGTGFNEWLETIDKWTARDILSGFDFKVPRL
ncbi:hypothetical protein COCSADRAFT_42058 [Bipolaris sorokiniana ND90Pr]|uniref:FAD/NAD(P)-binding domain-containing protein n=1 Tax=Cochliobolus sativus (strain ND90Pr / ATCC 201652) TaxID=665912 RepID=M2SM48_COCSN|nr:uncharacterized protein COCSADRAFT_42058 [Bipolaris sorokiniana ND90Pr]EMD58221.1 hypothetical protein COCSADRAFT_42058 [Bipolaris sorokiniana ND90Pr]